MGFTLPVPGCAATRARHVLSILSLRMHFRIPIRVLRAQHPKKGIVTMSPSYILHEWNIELSMTPSLCHQNGPELSMTSSLCHHHCGRVWSSFDQSQALFALRRSSVEAPFTDFVADEVPVLRDAHVLSGIQVWCIDLLNLWDVCVCNI